SHLDASEQENPPKDKIRMPLFEARVHPDIFFVGFDLTAEEARGADDNEPATEDNAGWFFVLQERPGEPRFGLDEPPPPGAEGTRRVNWNSLHWGDVGTEGGKTITLDKSITLLEYDAEKDQDNVKQPEDEQASFGPNTSSAELAYILYQVPAMVAIHAWRMLP
ncbi:MAG: hypothetical protein AAGF12_24645, partial [Myxococcota bacterium]